MLVVLNFLLHVGCRQAKQGERRRSWENRGYFQQRKNMDSLNLGFLYFGNSLRSIKRGSGQVFQMKEALKMVFGVCSIRVFLQFFIGSLL